MIQARFYCSAPEGSIHMVLQGHANFAQKGADTVCAGVSALACTLGEAVQQMYTQGMLRRYPRVEIQAGMAEVIAVPRPEFFQAVMLVFWMAELGVGLIGESYPACVSIGETLKMEKQEDEDHEAA